MITINEAVEFFLDNRDIIPVYTTPKGDYVVPVEQKNNLYLVIERQGQGIFLARLTPDLMRLEDLEETPAEEARRFIYRRLKEAGIAKY